MALNLPPLSSDVRARIPARTFQALGFPAPGQGVDDPVDSFIATASAYVASTTGRQVDRTLDSSPPSAPVIDWLGGIYDQQPYSSALDLGPIGFRAVILRVLQEMYHESSGYTLATIGQDYLQGFKAGSYSESRRDPNIILRSRGSVADPMINPWKELSDLLWLLLTAASFDYWQMRFGTPVAASITVEGDFADTWNAPEGAPQPLPGFGPPGMGGDFLWPGGLNQGWGGG